MTDVVRPYLVALIAMMSFVLSSGSGSPASDPPRTQCCLPSGQGQRCVVKTPNACRQAGGIDVGSGTCSPNSCGGATTTSTSTTLPALCGNGTIDAGEQCDPPGSSCGAGALCSADCTCPCDFLDPSVCLHPFPNDYFTKTDPAAGEPRPRGHAEERLGEADRSHRLQPRRRLQPGRGDRAQGAGGRSRRDR